MIKDTDKEQITKNIQYKFNTLLKECLDKVDQNLNPILFIYNKTNRTSFPQKIKNLKQIEENIKNLTTLEDEEHKLYFEEVSSDIGDYYIVVSIDIKTIQTYIEMNCIDSIIQYIIKQIHTYIEIDIKGLLEEIDNIEKCKHVLQELYDNKYDKYISYCKDTTKHEKYYKEYIQDKLIEIYTYKITGIELKSKIITHLNNISSIPYESKYIKNGKLAIFKSKRCIDEYIDNIEPLIIEFPKETRIEINDYKATRKVMQMSNENFIIISDGVYIYGISKTNEKINNLATIVTFNGYYSMTINIDKKNINFKYGNIINVSKVKEVTVNKAIESIESLFKNLTEYQKLNLTNIIEEIKKQKKGSMLIISKNASKEAERLKYQSTVIIPKEITEDIMKSISNIDGSIIIDENGICYAIGVIVDGVACKFGDKSRGARFNSAIKYINERKEEAVAIVISEDKMIDIIDKQKIEELEQQNKNGYIDYEKINNLYKYEVSNKELSYVKSITEEDLEEDLILLIDNTDNEILMSYKGIVYFKLNLAKKSAKYLKESIDILENKNIVSKNDEWDYYYLGINYMYLNNFLESEKNIIEAIKIDKSNKQFKFQLALLYLKQNNKEKFKLAETILEDLVNNHKYNSDKYSLSLLLYNLGVVYYKLMKYTECRDCINKAIALDSSDHLKYCYLGHANRKLEKFDEAKVNYKNAINLSVKVNSNYYTYLGHAYYESKDLENAIIYYEKACKHNIDEMYAHEALCHIYYYYNNFTKASEHLEHVVRLDPDNIDNIERLGNIYIKMEEYKKAKECYLNLTRLDDNKGYLFNNLAHIHKKLYEFKESFMNYNKAICLDNNNPEFYYNLSGAYIDAYVYHSIIGKTKKRYDKYLSKAKVNSLTAIRLSDEGSEFYIHSKRRLAEIEQYIK